MSANQDATFMSVLESRAKELLEEWVQEQLEASSMRRDLITEPELRRQSGQFLELLGQSCASGNLSVIESPEWEEVREFLKGISRTRLSQGFGPTETATFIFSLKQPLFNQLRHSLGEDAAVLAREMWAATTLLDRLGLYTTEVYQAGREEIIRRQHTEMLELSTPVIQVWKGILILPLIGTLDSARTQVVMESLLQSILNTSSSIAIIDITGVPAVDTMVAQHLLKTMAAARLMGASCIISGIRPQIAQTMVHLGVEFGDVVTRSSLADALAFAFQQLDYTVSQRGQP